MQLSVGVRTMAQLAVRVLIIVFGLAQLGVPGFRRITVTRRPPGADSCVAGPGHSPHWHLQRWAWPLY
jgi:hypothetical protein